MCNSFLEGIIIGGSGGALAGLTIMIINWIGKKVSECVDKRKVYNWLCQRKKSEPDFKYRNTRTIASWTNLTEDRVRYICSCHNRIHLSVAEKEDLWTVFDRDQAE
jgi:hypothetical protein